MAMDSKIVQNSKYRYVYGKNAKKDLQYENIKVTTNPWDSNLIKCNEKFIAVNWFSSGSVGSFAILRIDQVGKLPDQISLFKGHKSQILDTDFDPFNTYRIASASDDCSIGIWDIPKNYSPSTYLDDEENIPKDISPSFFLYGHARKVGHILYHPTIPNILASSSLDYSVKIWNIGTKKDEITLRHSDMVTSMSFSYDGAYLATISRDKMLRIWDIRENKIISETRAHRGPKIQRVLWLGDSNYVVTTGFSKTCERQIGLWNAFQLRNNGKSKFYGIDQSSGLLMPFFDNLTKILYVVGRGDANIRYYEFQNNELLQLSQYQSLEPQRGFSILPRSLCNGKGNELMKCLRLVDGNRIVPVSFFVPRRVEGFQKEKTSTSSKPQITMSASEWFGQKSDKVIMSNKTNVLSLNNSSKSLMNPRGITEHGNEKSLSVTDAFSPPTSINEDSNISIPSLRISKLRRREEPPLARSYLRSISSEEEKRTRRRITSQKNRLISGLSDSPIKKGEEILRPEEESSSVNLTEAEDRKVAKITPQVAATSTEEPSIKQLSNTLKWNDNQIGVSLSINTPNTKIASIDIKKQSNSLGSTLAIHISMNALTFNMQSENLFRDSVLDNIASLGNHVTTLEDNLKYLQDMDTSHLARLRSLEQKIQILEEKTARD
ncbi:uncharacterized protein NDAI_0D04730 [Naumovozyma dairenensis CBS 421]|uniref:Coronin n=1 Tax=Naumovozyma dairenensis (strain ATCC 10597 / BCRC 20456 / CBS 421 / NBRC 0211 / NRRL Y-12639) TaxID=1071378 RepID=G0WAH5_NAUDC|nr:hypothetical protein NDAI_0D04730 [Naumovozyma dairenensis CBS 421]CCD24786.1 hypothetical protein NDAI_0D04730 [Naumovozyma dairenensis CBS 421]